MHKNGLICKVKPLKPRLLNRHKASRFEYALDMRKRPESFWKSVLFTDESAFNLFGPDYNKKAWLIPGSKLLDNQVRQVVKFGGGKLNVWGVISYNGMGKLIFINGNMDSNK